jgi:putative pyruvate formate lyase activating enzyme
MVHRGEEPCISGTRGSGAVFFGGCALRCVFCQNAVISVGKQGKELSASEIEDAILMLQDRGVHNINLVTPTHYAPSIKGALTIARNRGLSIPAVYNTGGSDTEETVEYMSDAIDIWLPDLKYYKNETAKRYSNADGLPEAERRAIDRMVEKCGEYVIDGSGMMKRGVIVRILLLPGHVAEAKLNLKYLYQKYGDKIFISLMSQYTPTADMPPPLNRRVTKAEYGELVEYAERLGVKNAFIQEISSAKDEYIPEFFGGEIK